MLFLLNPALAAVLDAGGLGGALATDENGLLAGGVALTHLAGDFDAWVLFGPEDSEGRVVRAWKLGIGEWTPTFITDRKELSRRTQNEKADEALQAGEPPPEAPKRHLLMGSPLFRLGGDTWQNERFRCDVGGEGLFNLLDLAGVAPARAYAGLTFGGRTQVTYDSADHDARGLGALVLAGGVAAGGTVAQSVVGRLEGAAELDPFLGEVVLHGGALLGGTLSRADVPLGLRADGEVWSRPGNAWSTEWRAMFYALVSSD